MNDPIQQAIEAFRECLSTLSDFGLESSDAYQQALAALQAMQGEVEPVYAFRRKGLIDFCTCDKRRYLELKEKPTIFEVAIFYTHPQPAVPDGWQRVMRGMVEYAECNDPNNPYLTQAQALLSAAQGTTMSDAIQKLINAATDLFDANRAEAWRYPTVWDPVVYRLQQACQTLQALQGESASQPAVLDEDYKALYMELLYQVSTKHPSETRHDTAMRYIREAEDRTCGVSAVKETDRG
jgi:hypothetical protein